MDYWNAQHSRDELGKEGVELTLLCVGGAQNNAASATELVNVGVVPVDTQCVSGERPGRHVYYAGHTLAGHFDQRRLHQKESLR